MAATNRGAVAAGGTGRAHDRGRTPAQWYAYVVGATLVLVGLLGFIADATFDTGTKIQGDGFLGFEVNGWHNLVHLASGLFLLAMAPKRASAKTAAIAFGVVYGIVTIIGLIDGNDVLGILPVNAADNVLHIALSAAGLLAGFFRRRTPPDRPLGAIELKHG